MANWYAFASDKRLFQALTRWHGSFPELKKLVEICLLVNENGVMFSHVTVQNYFLYDSDLSTDVERIQENEWMVESVVDRLAFLVECGILRKVRNL